MKLKSEYLFVLLTLLAYVTIQSFAACAPLFPADDANEFSFVEGLHSGWQLLGSDAFGLFRPVKNLLFFLFAQMPDLRLTRLLAMGIGIFSYFGVRSLFRRLLNDPGQAEGVAVIWLLAPTLVSSTAWLSCVNIQLMCAFAALALVFHDRNGKINRLLSALFLFLALVSYESAVVVGPMIVLFDFFARSHRRFARSAWCSYALYAAVTLGYLALRHFVGSATSVNGSFDGVSRLEMAGASAWFTLSHFVSWLWPFGRMIVFGGYCHDSVAPMTLVFCWIIWLTLAAAPVLLARKRPLTALGLAWTVVGFLPVGNLLGLGNGPYGDYYLSLPSFGLALVVFDLLLTFSKAVGRLKTVGMTLAALMVCWRLATAVEAAQWARLWGDGESAYAESIRNFPEIFSNYQMLAEIKANKGDYEGALAACEEVERRVGPTSRQLASPFQVRALVALNRDRDTEQALDWLTRAQKGTQPGVDESTRHYQRGCILEDLLHDPIQAEREYRLSIEKKLDADSVNALNRLACLIAGKGDFTGAIALWEKAHQLNPDNSVVQINLAKAKDKVACSGCCP